MTYTQAFNAFKQADDAWHAALVDHFGKDAADARYKLIGENATPEIAKLHNARMSAMRAWHVTRRVRKAA
jgi:hypothetical protein